MDHTPLIVAAVGGSRVATGPGRFRHDPYARVVPTPQHHQQQPPSTTTVPVPCAPLDHEELANLLALRLPPRAPSACQSGAAASAVDAKFQEWNNHHVNATGRYYDDDLNSERTTPYPLMHWTCVTDDADSPLHVVNVGTARAPAIADISPTPGGDRDATSASIHALPPICGLSDGNGRGGSGGGGFSAVEGATSTAAPANHPMAVLRRGGRGGSFCFGRGMGCPILPNNNNGSPQRTRMMMGPVSSGETPLAYSTHTVASASPTITASVAGRAFPILRRGGGGHSHHVVSSPNQHVQQAHRVGGQIVFTPRNGGSAPACYMRHPSTACNSCASTPRFAGSSVWGPSDGAFAQPSTRPSPLIHASAAPCVQPHALAAAFACPEAALQYNSHNTICGLNSASDSHTAAAAGTVTSSASDFILSQPASEQLGLSFVTRGASYGDALVYAMGPRADSSPFYNDQRGGMPLCITSSGSFAGAAHNSAAATPGLPHLTNKPLPPPAVHPPAIAGGVNGGASSFRSARSCTSALRRAFELPMEDLAPAVAAVGSNAAANAHTHTAAAFDDIPFAASPTTDGSHAPMAFAEPTAVFVDSGAVAEMEHGGNDDRFDDADATALDRDDSLKFAASAAARRQAAAFGVAVAPRTMWLPGCGPSAPSAADTLSDDDDGATSSRALPPPPPPPLLRDEILREISHCRRRSGGGSRTSRHHHKQSTTPGSQDVATQQPRRVRHNAHNARRHQHGRREFGPCAVHLLSVEDPPALPGGGVGGRSVLPPILSVEALRQFDAEMRQAAETAQQQDGRPVAAFSAEFPAAATALRNEMRSGSAASMSSSSSTTSSSHRSWCSSVFAPETDPLHPLSVIERRTKREAALKAALGQSTPSDE